MSKFWELLEESIILQGVITVAFVCTYCYKMIAGDPIPDGLDNMMWAVLAFWFGTKSQAAVTSTIKRLGDGSSGSGSGIAAGNPNM